MGDADRWLTPPAYDGVAVFDPGLATAGAAVAALSGETVTPLRARRYPRILAFWASNSSSEMTPRAFRSASLASSSAVPPPPAAERT